VQALHTISGRTYMPLSRTTLTQHIDMLYRQMTAVLADEVCENSVSITTDAATFTNGASYLAVTAHYITSAFVMRDVTLLVARMTESHTGEYVSELLDSVIERFALENRVFAAVTDNGANFTKSVRINAHIAERMRCVIHTLQLSLSDAADTYDDFRHLCSDVQALVCRIRNSHLLSSELLDLQVEEAAISMLAPADALSSAPSSSPSSSSSSSSSSAHSRPLRLKKDAPTRFNSFCVVFERLLALRQAVTQLCANHPTELGELKLTLEQWQLTTDLLQVLQPVRAVCEVLEASTAPTYSLLIPLLAQLLVTLPQLAIKFGSTTVAGQVASFVANNVYSRVKDALESEQAQISMMLDPRVRTKQLPQYDKAGAAESLRSAYRRFANVLQDLRGAGRGLPRPALISASAAAAAQDSKDEVEELPAAKRTKCLFALQEESVAPASELDFYLREPGIALEACPLIWWKEKAGVYPTLYEMARVYLAIPASSAPSERVFSVGKITLDHKRRSLDPDRVARLVFLKKNMTLYRSLQPHVQ
jgi:hypothetical protein